MSLESTLKNLRDQIKFLRELYAEADTIFARSQIVEQITYWEEKYKEICG